ncbi:MAG: hypothetical protein ACLVGX_01725, partial [Oscillospiraceae bacterium]
MPPAFSPVEVTGFIHAAKELRVFRLRRDPGRAAVGLRRAGDADVFEHRAVRRKEQGCAAAGRLRRHLRDAVAVAVKRARKRGLRAADAVEPADAAVEGLVVICQRNIRAEQDGLARKGIALLDQLG